MAKRLEKAVNSLMIRQHSSGGQSAPLASINTSSPESIRWPHVGRYKVDVASFESVALPELQIKEDTNMFIIDEVGKMELYSSSFLPAVLRILDSNIPVLASIPGDYANKHLEERLAGISTIVGRRVSHATLFASGLCSRVFFGSQ